MPQRQSNHASEHDHQLPSLPMDQKTWQLVSEELALSGQQLRIVELILRGRKDKQIAKELGVSFHTVRAYLKIIFQRTDATDRIGLVLHVFALAQSVVMK